MPDYSLHNRVTSRNEKINKKVLDNFNCVLGDKWRKWEIHKFLKNTEIFQPCILWNAKFKETITNIDCVIHRKLSIQKPTDILDILNDQIKKYLNVNISSL